MALLVMKAGELSGKAFKISLGQRVIIGRTQGATLILPDTKLSRRHCVIEGYEKTGKYTLMDLGSLNGTNVNGEKITESILESGDIIELGTTQIEFRLQASDAPKGDGEEAQVARGKIADVKQAAMGKAEGETFLSAKHKFCEACGAETSPDDIQTGTAKVMKGVFLCSRCTAEFAKLEAQGKGSLAELMGILRRLEADAKRAPQAGGETEHVDGKRKPGLEDTVMGMKPID